MGELAWLGWGIFLLALGIPAACYFGIQIGYQRCLDDLNKRNESD